MIKQIVFGDSRPDAAATSETKDWMAKARSIFETDLNQPMRVCASASGYSKRAFFNAKRILTQPCQVRGAVRP